MAVNRERKMINTEQESVYIDGCSLKQMAEKIAELSSAYGEDATLEGLRGSADRSGPGREGAADRLHRRGKGKNDRRHGAGLSDARYGQGSSRRTVYETAQLFRAGIFKKDARRPYPRGSRNEGLYLSDG